MLHSFGMSQSVTKYLLSINNELGFVQLHTFKNLLIHFMNIEYFYG